MVDVNKKIKQRQRNVFSKIISNMFKRFYKDHKISLGSNITVRNQRKIHAAMFLRHTLQRDSDVEKAKYIIKDVLQEYSRKFVLKVKLNLHKIKITSV